LDSCRPNAVLGFCKGKPGRGDRVVAALYVKGQPIQQKAEVLICTEETKVRTVENLIGVGMGPSLLAMCFPVHLRAAGLWGLFLEWRGAFRGKCVCGLVNEVGCPPPRCFVAHVGVLSDAVHGESEH
jgi:hypothetical protein